MPRKLPAYVQAFTDRHDKPRFYFRRRGVKRQPLPGLPWTPTFMIAYGAALEASQLAALNAGGKVRLKANAPKAAPLPGSISALVAEYKTSKYFGRLGPTTIKNYTRLFDKLEAEYGLLPVKKMRRADVERMIDRRVKAGGPEAGNSVRRVLKLLMKVAIQRGYREDNPTLGVEKAEAPTGKKGYRTFSEADVKAFIAKFPLGTRQYLALALLLCTAQRRSDVVKLSPKNIVGAYNPADFNGRRLALTQIKTGKQLVIPIADMLQEALVVAAVPAGAPAFMRTKNGRAYTPESFSNLFSAWSKRAGITEQASPHTLRKAVARRLAQAGCSIHMIAAITGHDSLAEVENYTKAAEQEALADMAMLQLQRPKGLLQPQ
jgi:integrase